MTFDLRITIGVAAAVLASGCQRQPERWTADRDTAICTDRSGRRVSDDQCSQHNRHGGGGFGWYYLARNATLPFLGERARGGSYQPGAGRYVRAPVASAVTRTGAVSRGGFGGSGRFFGSGHA
jgi:hypothetical protein